MPIAHPTFSSDQTSFVRINNRGEVVATTATDGGLRAVLVRRKEVSVGSTTLYQLATSNLLPISNLSAGVTYSGDVADLKFDTMNPHDFLTTNTTVIGSSLYGGVTRATRWTFQMPNATSTSSNLGTFGNTANPNNSEGLALNVNGAYAGHSNLVVGSGTSNIGLRRPDANASTLERLFSPSGANSAANTAAQAMNAYRVAGGWYKSGSNLLACFWADNGTANQNTTAAPVNFPTTTSSQINGVNNLGSTGGTGCWVVGQRLPTGASQDQGFVKVIGQSGFIDTGNMLGMGVSDFNPSGSDPLPVGTIPMGYESTFFSYGTVWFPGATAPTKIEGLNGIAGNGVKVCTGDDVNSNVQIATTVLSAFDTQWNVGIVTPQYEAVKLKVPFWVNYFVQNVDAPYKLPRDVQYVAYKMFVGQVDVTNARNGIAIDDSEYQIVPAKVDGANGGLYFETVGYRRNNGDLFPSCTSRGALTVEYHLLKEKDLALGTRYLSRINQIFVAMDGTVTTGDPDQAQSADVDGDNSVTIIDYSIFSDYYDLDSNSAIWLTVGANGFRPVDADLDDNGDVSILDYSILSDLFDQNGERW